MSDFRAVLTWCMLGYFICSEWIGYVRYKAVQTWPTTQGIVESSHVQQHIGPRLRGYAESKMVFRYVVDGRILRSDQFALSSRVKFDWYSLDRDAHVKEYWIGKSITVWFDPQNPNKAYANVEWKFPWLMLFFVVVFGVNWYARRKD